MTDMETIQRQMIELARENAVLRSVLTDLIDAGKLSWRSSALLHALDVLRSNDIELDGDNGRQRYFLRGGATG